MEVPDSDTRLRGTALAGRSERHSIPARSASVPPDMQGCSSQKLLFAISAWSLMACTASSPLPTAVPDGLRDVRPVLVEGPQYEGCALALGGGTWLTCAHVIPADATEYKVANVAMRRQPIASGPRSNGPARIANDWTIVAGPEGVDGVTAIDLQRPIASGTAVWIVGWKRRDDADASRSTYHRCVVPARIAHRDNDGYWCLGDVPEGDYSGLSVAPVVQMEAGSPLVVGMYCGLVVTRRSMLGVLGSERRDYVFIRPPDIREGTR